MINSITTILSSSVRLSVPLAFAATGEFVAERAGTLNISVEAMMLGGAYLGALGSSFTGSAGLGLLFGMAAGLAVAVIHANFSHRLNANTFVVGLTLNVLVLGLTSYLLVAVKMTPHQVGRLTIPLVSHIPIVGKPLFSERWPAFLLYPLIPAVWWLVQRSRWGLEVRACGENPQAVDVTGIDVNRRRRQALLLCGLLSGLGGAYLSVGEVGLFNQNMTAGRGFIALAALIFGRWRPFGAFGAALLFGFASAVAPRLENVEGWANYGTLFQALPYVLTLIAVAGVIGRSIPPAAVGRPYAKQ